MPAQTTNANQNLQKGPSSRVLAACSAGWTR